MSEIKPADSGSATDFIREIVERDMEEGRYTEVVTRFPPEPNGFLHIGHAKSIVLNFGIADEWSGRCHLRFDDTNPLTEEETYAESMKRDIRWLGYDWGDHLYHAADYFERMYEYARVLIRKGLAYVDSQSEEEIRENRGTVTEAGTDSPYRDRSVDENLDLFQRMKDGEFEDGAHVLRARIDMGHPNMIMRDPVLYRIRHADHYRAGSEWCVYPMYDYAHCLEDAIEGITHSLCTLEFENNREIYDWILDHVGFEEPRPHQYEFARLNLDYTIMSKRKLLRLVKEGHVEGWDDPRMPTLAGIRRRGVPPAAVKALCEMVGVTKVNSSVDLAMFEYAIRDDLNTKAPRVMGVLRPLKVTVSNFPEGETEWLEAPYYPRDVGKEGTRKVPFTRELYIEKSDFREDPPEGFYRLSPGAEVRLRYGFFLRCTDVVKDPDTGEVTEIVCEYDPETRGGSAPDGRSVKGTIHWVSAEHAIPAEVRLYDRLFRVPHPDDVPDDGDFTDNLNPDSLVVLKDAKLEPSVAEDPAETRYQLERQGYFWRDPEDSTPDAPVFNRIVSLRDTWAEKEKEAQKAREEARAAEKVREEEKKPEGPPPGTRPKISEERQAVRREHPELAEKMARYRDELDLSREDADILTGSPELAAFFEEGLEAHDDPEAVAAWVVNEVLREAKESSLSDLPFTGAQVGELARLVAEDVVSRVAAKDVFAEMAREGGDPAEIVSRLGLEKVRDRGELRVVVDELLEEHPEKVAEYRDGKTGLLGFFIGQVMRRTDGAADPKLTREILTKELE